MYVLPSLTQHIPCKYLSGFICAEKQWIRELWHNEGYWEKRTEPPEPQQTLPPVAAACATPADPTDPHCSHSISVLLLEAEIPSSPLTFPRPLCHPQHQPIPPGCSSGVHWVLHWAELVCSFEAARELIQDCCWFIELDQLRVA